MTKRALITGVTGQSGSFLAALLRKNGIEVHGTSRSAASNLWRLKYLGIQDQVNIHVVEASDRAAIQRLVSNGFDMIFHLAAESSVAASLKHPSETVIANVLQTTLWLEAIRDLSPSTKFFNASSSEILGPSEKLLTENSPLLATNPYAVTKAAAYRMACVFRESFSLFVVNGILFNHESELRDTRFVTAKIVKSLCELKQDKNLPAVELGNVAAERDFSHASDFANGMFRSLCHETPRDYIFASGTLRSIESFFNVASTRLGFEPQWSGEGLQKTCEDAKTGRQLAIINPKFFRPIDEPGKAGDPSLAVSKLDWRPVITFDKLLERMIDFHR